MKGEVLLNIEHMKPGQRVKIYSRANDMFDNEVIEVYTIEKEQNEVYISYSKKNSFNGTRDYSFREKVKSIGTSTFNKQKILDMGLTANELQALKTTSLEKNVIRRGFPLVGVFDNDTELHFEYPDIINVEY